MDLKRWNWAAAGLHTIFALWATTLPNQPVTLYKFAYDVSTSPASDLDYAMTIAPGGSADIKALVVAFFAITAGFHVFYATDFFGKGWYTKQVLGYGWNPFRWIEYSITASIMIYVIAIVAGAKEESMALVAALITPGIMLQGLTVERELHQNALALWSSGRGERPAVDPVLVWFNFAPAWLFFGIKWYIIFNAYFTLKQDLDDAGKPLDSAITNLVYIQFVAFALFGVVQSIQVAGWVTRSRGHWNQGTYVTYEKMYIGLSFVAKAALGLSVAALLQ